MTDMTMNNNGNRKKYLVPLVVLLLCGVALTGAAYAYSSSVVEKGTVTEQYLALKVYSDNGESKGTVVSEITAIDIDWVSATDGANTTWTFENAISESYWLAVDSTVSKETSIALTSFTVGLFTNADCTDAYDGSALTINHTGIGNTDNIDTTGKKFTFTITPVAGENPNPAKDLGTLYVKVTAQSATV